MSGVTTARLRSGTTLSASTCATPCNAPMNRSGGHMAGLAQVFIKAFDGGVIENIRTRKQKENGAFASDTDRVEQPYLPKLTASTWDSFTQRCTIDNVLDGYLARFTFVTGA